MYRSRFVGPGSDGRVAENSLIQERKRFVDRVARIFVGHRRANPRTNHDAEQTGKPWPIPGCSILPRRRDRIRLNLLHWYPSTRKARPGAPDAVFCSPILPAYFPGAKWSCLLRKPKRAAEFLDLSFDILLRNRNSEGRGLSR